MSPLRWTTKSTRNLAVALTGAGHRVSHVGMGELLHSQGYSLQANSKSVEGKQHLLDPTKLVPEESAPVQLVGR